MAVTDPVPVTLPPTSCPERGGAWGASVNPELGGDTIVLVDNGSDFTSAEVERGGTEGELVAVEPNWSEGTVVIFSVSTSREVTLVTVPDRTVSPPAPADGVSLTGRTVAP